MVVLSIFVVLLSTNCENKKNFKNETTEEDLTVVIEYENKSVDLYEVSPKLHPMLDSIIEAVNECSRLNKKGLIYYTSVYKQKDSLLRINLNLQRQKDTYCPHIIGVFTYKKSIFVLGNNEEIDNLFVKTGVKIKFKCQKENILMYDIRDFSNGNWTYILENGNFKCISYGVCEKHWMDYKYYKSQEE